MSVAGQVRRMRVDVNPPGDAAPRTGRADWKEDEEQPVPEARLATPRRRAAATVAVTVEFAGTTLSLTPGSVDVTWLHVHRAPKSPARHLERRWSLTAAEHTLDG